MSIIFQPEKKLFLISTEHTSYGMEISPCGGLVHRYWGVKLGRILDLPYGEFPPYDTRKDAPEQLMMNQEYPGAGDYYFREPCLKACYSDGCRDTRLYYHSHKISREQDSETLMIELMEAYYPLRVRLYYRIYNGLDVLDRWAEVTNCGTEPIQLENVKSAEFYFPRARQYRMTHMYGKWSGEYQLQQVNLNRDKVSVETRTGVSGHESAPWFAVDNGFASENEGDVWAASLHWSGNWKIAAEVDSAEQSHVTMGINEFDFAWELEPEETFSAPVVTAVFSREGFGGASRRFHRYHSEHLLPHNKAKQLRPVLFNSWCAFEFDVNIEQQMRLAELAARTGHELFVMDDGWFGTRDNDRSGLGDWYPSKTKFPDGLNPLIEHVNQLGMKFGLWVEPEMVNPDSDLYRAHPDWILRSPHKEIVQRRNQYVLNFAREDVCAYIWDCLEGLLRNHHIEYLKWDMNRYLCEVDWPEAASEKQREIWTRYTRNVVGIFKKLQENFPDTLVENCASGGGRIDMGMFEVSDMVNISDSMDPLDRIRIFEGFTQVFPAKTSGTCFCDSPSAPGQRYIPPEFRYNLTMLGGFGTGLNLLEKSEEDLEDLAKHIQDYKEIREIIQNGDLYRLVSIYNDTMSAYEYVTKDGNEAVLFMFGKNLQFFRALPRVRLKGLNPDALYSVNGEPPISGRGLMTIGIVPELAFDYDSCRYHICRV